MINIFKVENYLKTKKKLQNKINFTFVIQGLIEKLEHLVRINAPYL